MNLRMRQKIASLNLKTVLNGEKWDFCEVTPGETYAKIQKVYIIHLNKVMQGFVLNSQGIIDCHVKMIFFSEGGWLWNLELHGLW